MNHRSVNEWWRTAIAVNQRDNAALVIRFMNTHGLNFIGSLAGDDQAIRMKSGPMDWGSPKVEDALRTLLGGAISGAVSVGSMDLEPIPPLPKALRAKSDGILVRGQQDSHAEIAGKLSRGEELVPLRKVSSAGEFWYMVRTKSGAIGWVRGVRSGGNFKTIMSLDRVVETGYNNSLLRNSHLDGTASTRQPLRF